MVILDSRAGETSVKDELRCVATTSGALCVMTPGMLMMLMWPAGSLVSLQLVRIMHVCSGSGIAVCFSAASV